MGIWLQLILLPLVGALIGWLTNWLAIKMLFRPRRVVNIAGLKVQGLLPKRRHDLAVSVGEVVERELVSHEDVKRHLAGPEFHDAVKKTTEKQVEVFIKEKLYSLHPLLTSVIPIEVFAEKVKGLVVNAIVKMIPELIEGFTKDLEAKLRFQKIVTEKIEGFEFDRLEKIVLKIARKELRYIEVFGGVLGFAIGLAQFAVIALTR